MCFSFLCIFHLYVKRRSCGLGRGSTVAQGGFAVAALLDLRWIRFVLKQQDVDVINELELRVDALLSAEVTLTVSFDPSVWRQGERP